MNAHVLRESPLDAIALKAYELCTCDASTVLEEFNELTSEQRFKVAKDLCALGASEAKVAGLLRLRIEVVRALQRKAQR
ncbi:MAG: hypothetical protein IRZ28_13205 [Steroidobacteraceae bacterium]|nr:hypothetical protein [Steroidobacteraceae bacterium]